MTSSHIHGIKVVEAATKVLTLKIDLMKDPFYMYFDFVTQV